MPEPQCTNPEGHFYVNLKQTDKGFLVKCNDCHHEKVTENGQG